jgi:Poly-adenylate binding protein, unique domain
LTGDEKRKILGNLMYYRVAEHGNVIPEYVPKITGMLIDLEVLELAEIVDILINDESLNDRVKDAVAVITDADN